MLSASPNEQKKQTELERLLSLFESCNDRMSLNLRNLIHIGHTLSDTNVPQQENKSIQTEKCEAYEFNSGILLSLKNKIDSYSMMNYELEVLTNKLSTII